MSEIIHVKIPNTFIGQGAVNNIVGIVRDISPSRILITTDSNLLKIGLIEPIRQLLAEAGFVTEVFDRCESNATSDGIENMSQRVKSSQADMLIAIGGGSVIDTTKVASQIAANDNLSTYDLISGKTAEKVIPKIFIPTTAGSGSEWSFVAMVSDVKSGKQKVAITSMKNSPDAVIIDPELTVNLPQKITADTGMDALVHTIEAYVSFNSNVISDMFALTAMKLISANIRQAYSKGRQNLESRYNMSVGASLAMGAVAFSGVGSAHLMGHPLEKRTSITHGGSCTLMLPYVIEFNLIACPEKYARIAEILGEKINGLSVFDAATRAIEAFRKLSETFRMARTLGKIGITRERIPEMAEEALKAYGPEISMWNPRDVSLDDAINIYTAAL